MTLEQCLLTKLKQLPADKQDVKRLGVTLEVAGRPATSVYNLGRICTEA